MKCRNLAKPCLEKKQPATTYFCHYACCTCFTHRGTWCRSKRPKQADDPRATGNLRPPNCPERMEERPKTIPFERALAGVCVKCEVLRATFRAEGGMDLMSAMKRIPREGSVNTRPSTACTRTLIEVKITAVRLWGYTHVHPNKCQSARASPSSLM